MPLSSAVPGLSSTTRLYDLEIEGLGSAVFQFEGFVGEEALSELYAWDLLLLSDDAQQALAALIGKQARFTVRLSDGSAHPRSGYIQQARRLGADGALTRYHLHLVPWLWQATQRTDCRVFQEKSVLDILEAVFAAYAPRMAWQLADGVDSFMAQAPLRSYCVQYRESDYAFVSRLLAEEGLGFCFIADPAGEADTEALSDAPGHSLLIFAHTDSLPEDRVSAHALGGTGVRFHQASAQEAQDAITALGAQRILQAALSTRLSWDYQAKRSVAASVPTHHLFGGPNAPQLEDYDPPGAYAHPSSRDAQRYLSLAREALEARNKTFYGAGSVRSFAPGHRFTLSNSPLDHQAHLRGEAPSADAAAASRHFLLYRVSHAGLNNLPRKLDHSAQALRDLLSERATASAHIDAQATAQLAALLPQARSRGYANAFSTGRVHIPWRPVLHDDTGRRLNPRPTAPGPQIARVVGPQGETTPGAAGEIYTDAHHRLRIQFPWQCSGPSGAESTTSTWLRLVSRYAGARMGLQHIPRIGMEVLVDFLENDIDRPIVLGCLNNGQGEDGTPPTPGGATRPNANQTPYTQAADHRSAHQGNRVAHGHSPAWHGEASAYGPMRNAAALSGLKSAEYNRPHSGYTQLVFDDSDAQQRIQLATTQAATQLNLGHLIHQADNYRGSHRGDGFELRTDAYGALRGARGLLLTTWPIQAAPNQAQSEPAGDATAISALLKQSVALTQATHDIARTHHSVQVAAHAGSASAQHSALNPQRAPQAATLQTAQGQVSAATAQIAGSGGGAGQSAGAGGGKSAGTGKSAGQGAGTGAEQGRNTGTVPHSEDPLLTLAGRGGLGLLAGQSLQWASGETLTWASGQDSNFALASHLRIHTGQALGILSSATGSGHLKLIANQGPLLAQAQADTLTLAAKAQLKMVSVNEKLTLASPKKIHLAVAGGASITLEGGNITAQCPGVMTVHASQRSFVGPGKVEAALPQFPNSSICIECLKKAMESGSPLAALN